MSSRFSISRFRKSLCYAWAGLKTALRSEQNLCFHLIATVATMILSFVVSLSRVEFALIIICIGLVLVAELVNTAIEKLCDKIAPSLDEQIKLIKDLSAAAVLLAAITAFICGLIIFLPRIFSFLS